MKTKILITGALHKNIQKMFKDNSEYDVNYAPDCTPEQIKQLVKKTEVLITRSETTIDKELIDAAPSLIVIARAAVGVGNIDTEYATKRGILVINTPGKNTNSAAELTLGLMLSVVRNIPQAHNHLKNGGWDRHTFTGNELRGKKLGIVGLGNVGHRVARFANAFDMKVYAYDPYIAPHIFIDNNTEQVRSLEELAAKVDFLSVHVPLNKETRKMVSKDIINLMHKDSYIINAARGGIVDENDLCVALTDKVINRAGIDTWENEPKPLNELLNHSNVWCTPHIGASTIEAQIAIGTTVYEQVQKALKGIVVDFPINLPQIGVINSPLLKSYAVLGEKLGTLAGQLKEFSVSKVEISYRGDLAGLNSSIIKMGFMKGYISNFIDDYVSFVNVDQHFEKSGISVKEIENPDFDSYKSALKVILHGNDNNKLIVGGVVFDEQYLKISLVNDFYFEVEPAGDFVVIKNQDKPGVVGDVGTFLAKENINIDTLDLSRNKSNGYAMSIIRIDKKLSEAQLEIIRDFKNIESCLQVSL